MPLYGYECTKCEQITTKLGSVAGRKRAPRCADCGAKTQLGISAPAHPVMNPARPVKPLRRT